MANSNDPPQTPQSGAGEQWVTSLLAEARARDRAPAQLRGRLADQRRAVLGGAGGTRRGLLGAATRPRGAAWAGGGAFALAALILVLVFALPAGVPAAPTLSEAAALATRGPAAPAPAPDAANPGLLSARVGDLAFPDWLQHSSSTASGVRTDRLAGRRVVTVYYAMGGRQVAYSIVASPVLHVASAVTLASGGYWFHVLHQDGRTVVTWTERNHTCILSGAGVPSTFLAGLVTG